MSPLYVIAADVDANSVPVLHSPFIIATGVFDPITGRGRQQQTTQRYPQRETSVGRSEVTRHVS